MEQLVSPAVSQLASSGILGAMLLLLLWAYQKKDQQLTEQSKDNLALVVSLQEKVITAVTKIADLMDFIERREREREREAAKAGGGPYRNPVPENLNWPNPPRPPNDGQGGNR